MSYKYGKIQIDWSKFQFFNFFKYNNGEDLIFKDVIIVFKGIVVDKQNYMGYFGDIYGKNVKVLIFCDVIVFIFFVILFVIVFMLFIVVLNVLFMQELKRK